MADFFDEDVTDKTEQALARLIKLRIRSHPSVQIFRKRKRVDGRTRTRTILRTWRIEFEVEDAVEG